MERLYLYKYLVSAIPDGLNSLIPTDPGIDARPETRRQAPP